MKYVFRTNGARGGFYPRPHAIADIFSGGGTGTMSPIVYEPPSPVGIGRPPGAGPACG
jgi:hypothetical protein